MDFTNINDPAGVRALLDQLRTSQAWQELKEESNITPSPHANLSHLGIRTHSLNSEPESESSPVVSNHISSLLSRLQPGGSSGQFPSAPNSWTPNLAHSQPNSYTDLPHHSDRIIHPSPASVPSSSRTKDPRFLTFNQALPVIALLSEDVAFMEKLEKLQEDQARLERTLWEERFQIIKAQAEKIQVAQAKALIIGTGISQRDAKGLQASFEKELKEFDREQVLTAWDALIAKQQAALEALSVPSMFTTTSLADREKQQRIIQVLEGLSDPINNNAEP